MFKNEGGVIGRLNNVKKNRRFGSGGRPLPKKGVQKIWAMVNPPHLPHFRAMSKFKRSFRSDVFPYQEKGRHLRDICKHQYY